MYPVVIKNNLNPMYLNSIVLPRQYDAARKMQPLAQNSS